MIFLLSALIVTKEEKHCKLAISLISLAKLTNLIDKFNLFDRRNHPI